MDPSRNLEIAAIIFGVIIGLTLSLVLGAVIGAILLRASISLCNKFLGAKDSPKAVPEPAFLRAVGISLLAGLVNGLAGFAFGGTFGTAVLAAGTTETTASIITQIVYTPISLFVVGGMLSTMLPTTFGRGMLVALFEILIIVAILVPFVLLCSIVLRFDIFSW